jgi:3D (Asp-Asp-Asp) domain-containing protein
MGIKRGIASAVLALTVLYQLVTRREPVTELAGGRGAPQGGNRPFTPLSDSMLPRLEPLLIDWAPFTGHDVPEAARPGVPVQVQITAYCLRGRTRSGEMVREGIVAADPRVFPLGSTIDLFIYKRLYGRFKVTDTGRHIKGPRIDIWKRKCAEALVFGRRNAVAVLVGPTPADSTPSKP